MTNASVPNTLLIELVSLGNMRELWHNFHCQIEVISHKRDSQSLSKTLGLVGNFRSLLSPLVYMFEAQQSLNSGQRPPLVKMKQQQTQEGHAPPPTARTIGVVNKTMNIWQIKSVTNAHYFKPGNVIYGVKVHVTLSVKATSLMCQNYTFGVGKYMVVVPLYYFG